MQQRIQLKYINHTLQIGLVNWREAYLLYPEIVLLNVEVNTGRLVYRAKGSSKRITYNLLKKGLVKTSEYIVQEVPSFFSDRIVSP
jgi:hypothetical protein